MNQGKFMQAHHEKNIFISNINFHDIINKKFTARINFLQNSQKCDRGSFRMFLCQKQHWGCSFVMP